MAGQEPTSPAPDDPAAVPEPTDAAPDAAADADGALGFRTFDDYLPAESGTAPATPPTGPVAFPRAPLTPPATPAAPPAGPAPAAGPPAAAEPPPDWPTNPGAAAPPADPPPRLPMPIMPPMPTMPPTDPWSSLAADGADPDGLDPSLTAATGEFPVVPDSPAALDPNDPLTAPLENIAPPAPEVGFTPTADPTQGGVRAADEAMAADEWGLTSELPRIAADPAAATTVYRSRVAGGPGGNGPRSRGGGKLLWVAAGLCVVGLLIGGSLAVGLVDLAPTETGTAAAPTRRPVAQPTTTGLPETPADEGDAPPATGSAEPPAEATPSRAAEPAPPRRGSDRTGALRSVATELCATAGRARGARGAQVLQSECEPDSDRWRLTQDNGEFTIVHDETGRCLTAPTGPGREQVSLAECSADEDQRWRLGIEGTEFEVTSVSTQRCLDVPAAARVEGLVLNQFTCNDSNAQSWQLVEIE
ncbi:RICIN domain-containing protein [Pilimelia anulata]|nr:RICIN domain-containing protein [Pilimelia anulata]